MQDGGSTEESYPQELELQILQRLLELAPDSVPDFLNILNTQVSAELKLQTDRIREGGLEAQRRHVQALVQYAFYGVLVLAIIGFAIAMVGDKQSTLGGVIVIVMLALVALVTLMRRSVSN